MSIDEPSAYATLDSFLSVHLYFHIHAFQSRQDKDNMSLCDALISKTEVQLNKATFAMTLIDLSMPPLLG